MSGCVGACYVMLGQGGHVAVRLGRIGFGWASCGKAVPVRLGRVGSGLFRFGMAVVVWRGLLRYGQSGYGGQLTANRGEKIWLVFQRKNVKELLTNT